MNGLGYFVGCLNRKLCQTNPAPSNAKCAVRSLSLSSMFCSSSPDCVQALASDTNSQPVWFIYCRSYFPNHNPTSCPLNPPFTCIFRSTEHEPLHNCNVIDSFVFEFLLKWAAGLKFCIDVAPIRHCFQDLQRNTITAHHVGNYIYYDISNSTCL